MRSMALIEWKDSFSVGNDEIDRQHKRLFQLTNELHDGMMRGEGRAVVGSLLEQVISYTKTHFAAEEQMMAQAQYPDLPAHRAKHQDLTRQVTAIYDEYRSGGAVVTLKVLTFLKDWLQNHILETDKRYSGHVSGNRRPAVRV